MVPLSKCRGHLILHAHAVVSMEAVTFDEGGIDVLPAEDLLEGAHHRCGAGARGAGDGDDGVLCRASGGDAVKAARVGSE
jgi:hypothetical protein